MAKKRQRGDPKEIVISDNRIMGLSSDDFIAGPGIVIRDHSPLHITRWKRVPMEVKNKMLKILKVGHYYTHCFLFQMGIYRKKKFKIETLRQCGHYYTH